MASKTQGLPPPQPHDADKPKLRGVVKSVLSGDTIVVHDPASNPQGAAPERVLAFSHLSAPKFARRDVKAENPETNDEAYAWESREFLRKKAAGKKVLFTIDYTTPTGREYATVKLVETGEVLNQLVLSEGWATIFKSQTGKEPKKPEFAEYQLILEAAEQAGKGVHNKEPYNHAATNRITKFDSFKLYNQLKGKELKGVVEQIRNGSTFRIVLTPTMHEIVLLLAGVQTPSSNGPDKPAEPFHKEARAFAETHVLHRDVSLKIESLDKQGNFIGSIEVDGHDVGTELLSAGLGQFVSWSANARGQALAKSMLAAEATAKAARKRIWASHVEASPAAGGSSSSGSPKEINGTVTSVVNTGSVIIQPDNGGAPVQVTLASLKVPRPGYPDAEKDAAKMKPEDALKFRAEIAWANEGKEFLRKRLVGNKVKAVLEYVSQARKDKNTGREIPEKSCYTIHHDNVNVAIALVEQGLATVAEHRGGEERSRDYEALVLADLSAKNKNRGFVYAKPEKAPFSRVNDFLSGDSASLATRARQFLPFLQRGGTQRAIVDHVFSGSRLKLSIPKENCVISLNLTGIRVPRREENPELSNQAMAFTREQLHQREVIVVVEGVDKGGNFTGVVTFNKRNYALQLLENGFASVHSSNTDPDAPKSENAAKLSRRGIWKDWDEEAERKKQAELTTSNEAVLSPGAARETLEVIVTEVIDGATFYMQDIHSEAAGLEELVGRLTRMSVEEGPQSGFAPSVGELVRGQFTEDDQWYRAKVVAFDQNRTTYTVQYVDYGNGESISSSRVRPLPLDYKSLSPQAQLASLAFVKAVKLDADYGREAVQYFKELTHGRTLLAVVEYRVEGKPQVTLRDESNASINAALIQAGVARVDSKHRRRTAAEYLHLKEEEEVAKKARRGIWQYGDAPDSDEDEDAPRGRSAWGKPAEKAKPAEGKPVADAKPKAAETAKPKAKK